MEGGVFTIGRTSQPVGAQAAAGAQQTRRSDGGEAEGVTSGGEALEIFRRLELVPLVVARLDAAVAQVRVNVNRAVWGENLGVESSGRQVQPDSGAGIINALAQIGFDLWKLRGQCRLHDR